MARVGEWSGDNAVQIYEGAFHCDGVLRKRSKEKKSRSYQSIKSK